MSSYYCAIFLMTVGTMVTSLIHFKKDNQTLSRRVRDKLACIATLIVVGVVCEFLGLYLNGSPEISKYVYGSIKALELSVSPIIPIIYVQIVDYKDVGKPFKLLAILLLIFNAFCEILSIFTPFIFFIDKNNNYVHGKFYAIYIIMYFSGIAIFILEVLRYSKKYQIRNLTTLAAILVFLLVGFSIRLVDSKVYSDWLVVSQTYLLFIIYYSDLSLKVDELTDLLNRKSYEHRLKKLDYASAIILLDANNFKLVNDKYGHQVGDNVLKIISQNILKAYSKYGYCYRIGGDEFCVILKPGIVESFSAKYPKTDISELLDSLNSKLDELLQAQLEDYPMLEYGVAKGYALFSGLYDLSSDDEHYTLSSVKEAVKLADQRMYMDKARHQKA